MSVGSLGRRSFEKSQHGFREEGSPSMPPSTLIRLLVPRTVNSLGPIDKTQPIGRERERERESVKEHVC